jgi:hypothetical protein
MLIRRSAWLILTFGIPVICLVLPAPSSARTWYVKADSTGDAPSIHAGLDSASYGDTVLVAPGTYLKTIDPETWISPGPGVCLTTAGGPEVTAIEFCDICSGITLSSCEGARVSGFTVRHGTPGPDCGYGMGHTYGITCYGCTDVVVENCVVDDLVYGILVEGESLESRKPVIRDNTIVSCSYGITCWDSSQPSRPLLDGNTIISCGWGVEVLDAQPHVESCKILDSGERGMTYSGHCGGNVNKCVIAYTGGNGVSIWSHPSLAAPWFNGSWLPENANDFYGNSGWDIWYEHTSEQGLVMAPYNYWGSDCPDFATKIHGGVIYSPWMDSTHTQVLTEDDCPEASDPSTWGSIKAIFR